MSGGRSTTQAKSGKLNHEQAGDISAVGLEGHKLTDRIYFECKFYHSLGIANFLLNRPAKLTGFWEEALKNATSVSKIPMILAKENYFPELVITTSNIWSMVNITNEFPKTRLENGVEVFLLEYLLGKCTLL